MVYQTRGKGVGVGASLEVANMYMFTAFYFPGFLSLQRHGPSNGTNIRLGCWTK